MNSPPPHSDRAGSRRLRLLVTGRVQGVGFRPCVFRLATSLGLAGLVRNDTAGVVIEVEGPARSVSAFVRRLRAQPPAQARIAGMVGEKIPAEGGAGFRIVASARSGDLLVGLPPDLALCPACRAEIQAAGNRRQGHAFANCTDCGPRFTLARGLPYDRARTSMAVFPMCPACAAEYADPADRRFDAQPIACPACGPRLSLLGADGRPLPGDPLRESVRLLRAGRILAVKGVGGFHLACDARSDDAVALLRRRKNRPAKSLAVLFADLAQAGAQMRIGPAARRLLASPAAPVVIVPRRPAAKVSRLLSPDTNDLGVLLPYTPLHALLAAGLSPLVLTSGNRAEEPIACDEAGLAALLGPLADAALTHDRAILRRCDDSVVRLTGRRAIAIRRSRGFVPEPVCLGRRGPPVLAFGADQKSVFCATRGDQAFLSQHIGDLDEPDSCSFLGEAVADFLALLGIEPRVAVHDLHPGYRSTRQALASGLPERVAVQHHHAHVAACLAEHGSVGPVLGVALDGTGYGPDGTVWGGEFLVADLAGFRRAGRFKRYRLPGGEAAIRQPARMAYSVLRAEFGEQAAGLAQRWLPGLPEPELPALARLVDAGIRSPWTSSAGRLFDAVSALLGEGAGISYEGQAAVRLETLAGRARAEPWPVAIRPAADSLLEADFGPALRGLLAGLEQKESRRRLAARFHATVAEAVADMCRVLRSQEGLGEVALSGGVFQNALLLDRVVERLGAAGFRVLAPGQVPPNDAGIALGQAAVALARLAGTDTTSG